MHPEKISVGDILETRYPLYVAPYQRGYSWETDELNDFVSDLSIIRASLVTPPGKMHFLGGIVAVQYMELGKASPLKFEVVDGQQRLATFTLALSVLAISLRELATTAERQNDTRLRDLFNLDAASITEDYLLYYETDDASATKKDYQRLKLSKSDDPYFRDIVRGSLQKPVRNAPLSNKKMHKAAIQLRDELVKPCIDSSDDLATKLDNLRLLKRALTDSCYVILIRTEKPDEAYELFSVLNDRGKALSYGDLLRAYTLQTLEQHDGLQAQAESTWDRIMFHGTKVVDEFLTSYYASYTGKRSSKGEVFRDLKHDIFQDVAGPLTLPDAQTVSRKLQAIREEQVVYNQLIRFEWPYDPSRLLPWDKERLGRVLQTLRHDLCIPLLLSLVRFTDETVFRDVLQLLERFVFRYITIAGAHAGRLRDLYYRYSALLRNNQGFSFQDFERELCTLANDKAPNEVFEALLDEGSLDYSASSSQQRSYIKHFLATLDDYSDWYNRNRQQPHLGRPDPSKLITIDLQKATLEHVYPQNAGPNEQNNDLDRYVNDIGNLLLLSEVDNNRIGNKPFAAKKNVYQQSRLNLSIQVGQMNDWTVQAVNDRRAQLIDMALKVFRIGVC